jgi:lysophospholipase L1-like esterase
MLEPVVRWQVNSEGERGSEYVPGHYRVLLAGGSCVESYYLDQATAVGGQLEQLLGQPAALEQLQREGVHVGSVARSRMTCEQLDTMLRPNLPRYGRLDCVILMVGASDMVRWLELGTPTEPWTDVPSDAHLWGLHPRGPFGWSPRRLALRALAMRARDRWAPSEIRRSGVGRRMIANRKARAAAPKLDEVPDPTIMVARFEQGLNQLLTSLEGVADRIVVARQPWFDRELTPEEDAWMWNFGQGVIYTTPVDVYYTHRVVRELMTRVAERCGAVTRARGHLDLDTPAALEPGLENYYDFFHYTVRGAARVAELMRDAVLAERPR